MKLLPKAAVASLLSLALSATVFIDTAQAMPVPVPAPQPSASAVQDVQYHRGGRPGWYHGHRGYRGYRRGYRRHSDGWWYPLAAFGAGAVIGGAIAAPPRRGLANRHYQWCASRYQTYRASDNTYVPRVGVRAQCVSPYS